MIDFIKSFADLPITTLRKLRAHWEKLWVRVCVMGASSLLALGITQVLGHMIPDKLVYSVSGEAVDRLLDVIANAMLAVVTFSLTVMVTVYRNSSAQFTPRLHRLIVKEPTTQKTLAAFIGAYVYALTAIILRELDLAPDDQAYALFATTVLVLIYVVWSMVRWVLHLQTFGSLTDTTQQLEQITIRQLNDRFDRPCLGANPWQGDVPDDAKHIVAMASGYVQEIFQEKLNARANQHGLEIWIASDVGSYQVKGQTIAHVRGKGEHDDLTRLINDCIVIDTTRSFEQDPRFGLIVLGEIGSKALSAGINDPGTAIDIISRQTRILQMYQDETKIETKVVYDRLWVRPLEPSSLIDDAFGALSRDGKSLMEVQVHLQKALTGLADHGCAEMADAARHMAKHAVMRAMPALDFAPDRARLLRAVMPALRDDLDVES